MSSSLRDDYENRIFFGDDGLYFNLAKNFFNHWDSFLNFTPLYSIHSTSEIIDFYPDIPFPFPGKGPLYPLVLGSFISFLDETDDGIFFYASFFSNILTSIFLTLVFLFVSKYYNFKIGIITSSLILFSPFLTLNSLSVQPTILLFIFSISSLFFLKKKTSHYFMFGLFVGLAHLTHPFGMMLGISYVLLLFLQKKPFGLLTMLFSWQILLIPWFIRNYYYFGDIGQGLSIFFSQKISHHLTFLPISKTLGPSTTPLTSLLSENIDSGTLYPLSNMVNWLYFDFEASYAMIFVLFFVFSFLLFGIIKFEKVPRSSKFIIIFFLILLSIITISMIDNFYLQIIGLLIIPIILIGILIKKNKDIFIISNNSTLVSFSLIFSFVTFLGLYFLAISAQYPWPEPRFVMFALFLLIPISISGFERLIAKIQNPSIQKFKFVFLFTVFAVLTVPLLFGTSNIDFPEHMLETENMKKINQYLNEEIDVTTIASNQSFISSLRTDHNVIQLPLHVSSLSELDEYISHYGIEYLIFYNVHPVYAESVDGVFTKLSSNNDPLIQFLLDDSNSLDQHFYEEVFSLDDSSIFKITIISESTPADGEPFIVNIVNLDKIGNIDVADKLFLEIEDTKQDLACTQFVKYLSFERAFDICIDLINKKFSNGDWIFPPKHNQIHENLKSIIYYFEENNQKDKVFDLFSYYEQSITNYPNNSEPYLLWSNMMSELIQNNEFYIHHVSDLLSQDGTLIDDEYISNSTKSMNRFNSISFNLCVSSINHILNNSNIDIHSIANYDSLEEIQKIGKLSFPYMTSTCNYSLADNLSLIGSEPAASAAFVYYLNDKNNEQVYAFLNDLENKFRSNTYDESVFHVWASAMNELIRSNSIYFEYYDDLLSSEPTKEKMNILQRIKLLDAFFYKATVAELRLLLHYEHDEDLSMKTMKNK